MPRTRISTTVDTDRLERCRRAFGLPDSELIDRALASLLRDFVTAHERRAIGATPYEHDPDLAWQAPPGPDLPYEGDIPEDVHRLAAARRAQHGSR